VAFESGGDPEEQIIFLRSRKLRQQPGSFLRALQLLAS
jgi:hypothetical protein